MKYAFTEEQGTPLAVAPDAGPCVAEGLPERARPGRQADGR